MDFLNNMDMTQKVILGVALVTLVVVLVIYFTKKSEDKPRVIGGNGERHLIGQDGHGQRHLIGQDGHGQRHLIGEHSESPPPQPQLQPGSRGVVAMFFAPWCGHCKTLEPIWNEIMSNFDGINGLKLLKVNGDENPELVQKHGVQGFPTIKYCPGGLDDPNSVPYNGDRSPQSIMEFLQQC